MFDALHIFKGVVDGHVHHIDQAFAVNLAAPHPFVEAGAATVGTGTHGQHGVKHGGMKKTLFRVDDAAVHSGDKPFVFGAFGPVVRRVFEFDLGRVEEKVELFGRVVLDFLVEVEESAVCVTYPAPSAFAESNIVYGVFVVERLVEIHKFVDVQLSYFP